MSNNLITHVRKVTDTMTVIDISGELNGYGEEALMEAYTQASNGRSQTIILNFTNLEYMNSSGIGLLVTLLIRVQRQKQRLLAYGLSDHYQQIFELTRLNEAITIFDSEQAALTATSSLSAGSATPA
ncbi:MAG: STAS domain-containing protein [Chloroflexota bacterium]